MAHFYGSVEGSRGEATRCGTKNSGITAHARGWDIGGHISMGYQVDTEEDAVEFLITSGSNGGGQFYSIGTFTRPDLDRLISGDLKMTLVKAGNEESAD